MTSKQGELNTNNATEMLLVDEIDDEIKEALAEIKDSHYGMHAAQELIESFETLYEIFEPHQMSYYFSEHFLDLCAYFIKKEKRGSFQALLTILCNNSQLTQEEKITLLFSTCADSVYKGANLLSILGQSEKEESHEFLALFLDTVDQLYNQPSTELMTSEPDHDVLYKRARLHRAAPIGPIYDALFAKDMTGFSAFYYAHRENKQLFNLFFSLVSQSLSQAPERLPAILADCSLIFLNPSAHPLCFNKTEKNNAEGTIFFQKTPYGLYYKQTVDTNYAPLTREDCFSAGMTDLQINELFNTAIDTRHDEWMNVLRRYHTHLLGVLFSKGDLKYCSLDERSHVDVFLKAILFLMVNNRDGHHHLLGRHLASFHQYCQAQSSNFLTTGQAKNYVERQIIHAEKIRKQSGDSVADITNSSYTYTDDDITALMTVMLVPEGIAVYAPQHPLVAGQLAGVSCDLFQLTLKDIFSRSQISTMLINITFNPINFNAAYEIHGTHWITLVIFPSENTTNPYAFEAKIIDSMPSSPQSERYIEEVIKNIRRIATESSCSIELTTIPTEQQSGDLDCGVWGCENAKNVALRRPVTSRHEISASTLRMQHAHMIESYNDFKIKSEQHLETIALVMRNGRSTLREAILDSNWRSLYRLIEYIKASNATASELVAYFMKRYSLLSNNINVTEYALNELCCAALLGSPDVFKILLEWIVYHPYLSTDQKQDILFQTSIKKTNCLAFIAEAKQFDSLPVFLKKLDELSVPSQTVFHKMFEKDSEGLSAFYYALNSDEKIMQSFLMVCCRVLKETSVDLPSVANQISVWADFCQNSTSHVARKSDAVKFCLDALVDVGRSESQYLSEACMLLDHLLNVFEVTAGPLIHQVMNQSGAWGFFSESQPNSRTNERIRYFIEYSLSKDLPIEILTIFSLRENNTPDIQNKIESKWLALQHAQTASSAESDTIQRTSPSVFFRNLNQPGATSSSSQVMDYR